MAIAVYTSFGQQLDASGVPISGAKVYVYAAGTTTPLDLFSDTALATARTNPIVCDSSGRHDMAYIAAGTSYKVIVKTSADVTVYTRDNIDPGVAVGAGALPIAAGGTSATTAGAARTALDVPANSVTTAIASDVSTLQTRMGTTDATALAIGTTAQRPGSPAVKDVRYNTDLSQYEAYAGAAWAKLLTAPYLPADASTGFFIGYTYGERTSNSAIAGTTPIDDTIPQITEGAEVVSITTPTPQSTSSKFLLIYNGEISNGNGDLEAVVCFHRTGTTNALASQYVRMSAAADVKCSAVFYIDSPAASSAVTYSVRAGNASGINMYVNGSSSGRLFGGSSRATLIAIEIKG